MDKNLSATIQKHIELTVQALRKNRFEAHYIPTVQELHSKIKQLMPSGCSCSLGGSVTLDETGVRQLVETGGYNYYDRYAPGIDAAAVMRQALSCDVYLTGTNAITADGKLYNVDGRGNRVAAICFGPSKVIVVAGYNKIVPDIEAARERVRRIAAPANVLRLGRGTPCGQVGICQDCASDKRICCSEVVTSRQIVPERVCVLILSEQYGY